MAGRIASRIKEMWGLPPQQLHKIYEDSLAQLYPYGDKSIVNTRMAKDINATFVPTLEENPYAETFVEFTNHFAKQNNEAHKGVDALAYVTDTGNRVWINPELPTARQDRLKTQELAHLGFNHTLKATPPLLAEIEAEASAYGVGYRLGQPNDANLNTVASYLTPYFQQYGRDLDINETIASRIANLKTMTDRFTKGIL